MHVTNKVTQFKDVFSSKGHNEYEQTKINLYQKWRLIIIPDDLSAWCRNRYCLLVLHTNHSFSLLAVILTFPGAMPPSPEPQLIL